MSEKHKYKEIPTDVTKEQFDEFFCPHLSKSHLGRNPKLSAFKIFRYILKFLYTGVQWKELPIEKDASGKPEIHYSNIFRRFQKWRRDRSLDKAFTENVSRLQAYNLLRTDILHGDGTATVAKKGGDNIGYNGHKHHKGEKVVAITDRNGNVISPFVTAPGNRNETVLLKDSMTHLSKIAKTAGIDLGGSVMSLDAGYDSISNRKLIFNRGMIPNIKEIKRRRKAPKRGRKRLFDESIFQERFRTVERTFAWEDKFKRLLMRFERKSANHFGLKIIAYTMINLRHFC